MIILRNFSLKKLANGKEWMIYKMMETSNNKVFILKSKNRLMKIVKIKSNLWKTYKKIKLKIKLKVIFV